MKIFLPEYVKSVITRLEENGFHAYAVGGCVRDAIMGVLPHDYDICTDAHPEKVVEIFADHTVIETGIKHGTVTVLSEGNPIEITVFRSEAGYSDGRHPDSVTYSSSLAEDLSRRDFTINAMAYSDSEGLIDLFGGKDDIKNKMIRCIGKPEKRFSEDHLRIMRAVRFASVLGFKIADETKSAMLRLKSKLGIISYERIAEELSKTVCGDFFESVFSEYSEIFTEIIPELSPCIGYDQNNPHHSYTLGVHLAKTVSASPKDKISRLSALFHDIEKPSVMSLDENGISHFYSHAGKSAETAEGILKRLRFSNSDTEAVKTLIRYHDGVIEPDEAIVKRKLAKLGEDRLRRLLCLQRADRISQRSVDYGKDNFDAVTAVLDKILDEQACFSLKDLKANGNDMLSLGLVGRDIGYALSFLLDAVIDGCVKNEKSELLSYFRTEFKPQNQDKGV